MSDADCRRLYHSFPRRKSANPLTVLKGMVDSGILLTPEIVDWPGTGSQILQCRASFTLLRFSELQRHAAEFGAISLEFDPATLPFVSVAYIPREAHELVSVLSRLQRVLERTVETRAHMQQLDPQRRIGIANNEPKTAKETIACTPLGVVDILDFIVGDAPSLLSQIKAVSGILYPADDPRSDARYAYFAQREWRVLSGFLSDGWIAVSTTAAEQADLSAIDRRFFSRQLEPKHSHYRLGSVAEESRYLRRVNGASPLSLARRLLCPVELVEDAKRIVEEAGLQLAVEPVQQSIEH